MAEDDGGPHSLIDDALASERLLTSAIWGELRTFLAVARLGSANRAADVLGISHTSVGRQLRRLRDVLKQDLVVITRRGTFLTGRGKLLAASLTEVDTLLSRTISDWTGASPPVDATVRLRVTDGIGFTFVVPALQALGVEHPGIKLFLGRPQPYELLHDNTADIVVGFADDTRSDMTTRRLGVVHMIPIASRAYVAHYGSTLGGDDWHQYVVSDRYMAPGKLWKPWRDLVATGAPTHGANPSVTYGAMVKSGLGIGLMPAHNVCEPSFVPLHQGWSIGLRMYAVCLTKRLDSRAIRIVFDFLTGALGEDQPWLDPELDFDALPPRPPPGYSRILNLAG